MVLCVKGNEVIENYLNFFIEYQILNVASVTGKV